MYTLVLLVRDPHNRNCASPRNNHSQLFVLMSSSLLLVRDPHNWCCASPREYSQLFVMMESTSWVTDPHNQSCASPREYHSPHLMLFKPTSPKPILEFCHSRPPHKATRVKPLSPTPTWFKHSKSKNGQKSKFWIFFHIVGLILHHYAILLGN